MMNERITLANVYGPSAGDNPGFFERIFKKIKEVGNNYTIIGGDWNVVLDVNLDTCNYKRMVVKATKYALLMKGSLTERERERERGSDVMTGPWSLAPVGTGPGQI